MRKENSTEAFYISQILGNIDQANADVENMKNYLSKYDFDFKERERSKKTDPPAKKRPNTYVKFTLERDMDQTLWMLNDAPTFAEVNAEFVNLK